MTRATLKNLLAHKLRLGLSAVAVILGVAFVAGSLIFTDTLGKSFRDLFGQTVADVNVTPKAQGSSAGGPDGAAATIPDSVRAAVARVDGVDAVEGDVTVDQGVQVVGKDNRVLGGGGAPGIGTNWYATEGISALRLEQGAPPRGRGEIAIDTKTAQKGGLAVGDTIRVLLPEDAPIQARITGIFRFGESGNLAGASLTAFETPVAQELLLEPGEWSSVGIRAAEGVDDAVLRDRVAAAVGPGAYEVRTAAEQAEENASELQEGLRFINIFLLVFAGVAVFVGSFIILNTFSMLVAQRTRELAMLRALGASRRQVTRSVLLEALVVGALGAGLGLATGLLLAIGLQQLFGLFGLEFGGTALVVSPRTVLVSIAVGLVVTLVSAYFPARRAAKVPPVAAMRDDVGMAPRGLRLRSVVGTLLTLAGAGLLALGLVADVSNSAAYVGAGVLLVLVGVAVLSPVLSRPVVGVLGAAFPRLFGTVGRLGRNNAQRNPRRTAATASALMIGLALVGAMGTLAASTNASIESLIDDALGADYVVSSSTQAPFSPAVAGELRSVDGVEAVSQQRLDGFEVRGQESFGSAVDPATVDRAIQLDFVSGGTAGLQGPGLLVDESVAQEQGIRLGDSLPVSIANGPEQALRVGGVYETNQVIGEYVVSLPTYEAAGGDEQDSVTYVVAREGTDVAALKAGLEAQLADYPNVSLKDQTEFKNEQKGQVNQLTSIIYALLGLSVLIAVLGIVNTLALSVIERTREIGLLRAVGMSRTQLRWMVRLESVVISLFGAVLGLTIGVAFGVALQRALADDGISTLAIPWLSLAVFLVVAAVIGVLAALWPARRAARLNVLQAIATQ